MCSGKMSSKTEVRIKEMAMTCKLSDKTVAALGDGTAKLDLNFASCSTPEPSAVKTEFPSLMPLKEGLKLAKNP